MRAFAAIVIGIVAGLAALLGLSWLGNSLYPVAVDASIASPVEQAAAAIADAPLPLLLIIAGAWFAAGLVGGWAAKSVSGRGRVAWVTVAILTLLLFANIFFAPFPGWMQIASVAAPLIGGLLGNHLSPERPVPDPALD